MQGRRQASLLCSCAYNPQNSRTMGDPTLGGALQQSDIPTEVVHGIVSHVVASFLDDLFEGPLALDFGMSIQLIVGMVRYQA